MAYSQEELIAITRGMIIDNTTNQITPDKVRSVFEAVISSLTVTDAANLNAVDPLVIDAFTNTFSILQADATTNGYLSKEDWILFNSAVGASTPDATDSVKGKLKLSGDLSGTADSPTVPGKLNKGGYTGTAQDLKTDIDNIYQPNALISSVPPTRSVNTFTYPANQYEALINKTIRTNPAQFITTINVASTTDHERVDLIWFKDDNTLVKTVGTESLTVAQRPDIPVGQIGVPISFINVFGDVVENPTPINDKISIQNAQGVQVFEIDTYLRVEGAELDAPTKKIKISPFTPFTVFIDTINGVDATGQIENKARPFKTDTAAYAALPPNDGTEWKLLFIDTGSITRIMHLYPNRPIKIECLSNGGVFDFSALTGTATNTSSLYINIPNCDFRHVSSTATMMGSDAIFTLYCRNMTISTNGSLASNGILCGTAGSLIQCLNCTETLGAQFIGINGTFRVTSTLTLPNTGTLTGNRANNTILEIGTLAHSGTGAYSLFGGNGSSGSFTISAFTGNGTIYIANNYSRTMTIVFRNAVIPSTMTIALGTGLDATCNHFVSGSLSGTSKLSIGTGNVLNVFFQNFEGWVNSFDGAGISINIFNSTFYTAAEFMNGSTYDSFIISGTATFIQTTPGALITNLTALKNLTINGFLKTNAKLIGLNVNAIYNSLTFKEKANEIVVRDKRDIANITLNSNTTYVIDASLVLLSGEYIQVPAGGLTIIGYGFDVSKISKSVSGQSIFISPSGNSGNLVLKDMTYEPGVGSVFNITDSNGSHAIELNDINFQGVAGSSLGIFNGYRQFTGTTCGFYGLSDGFTLDGNWSGWKLTNSNVIGFAASGTLFKKGASLAFSNRFYIDLNLQIATGSKICDFADTNFINNQSLQVVNCYNRVNGDIDPNTTGITFPNILPTNLKSYFVNNVGIKNSFITPYGISSTNMLTYADDAAAAAGGIIQVGDTYFESSTGYLKKRIS